MFSLVVRRIARVDTSQIAKVLLIYSSKSPRSVNIQCQQPVHVMTKRRRDAIIEISENVIKKKGVISKKIAKRHKSGIAADTMGCLQSKKLEKDETIEDRSKQPPVKIRKKRNLEVIDESSVQASSRSSVSQSSENNHVEEWDAVDYIIERSKIDKSIAETLVQLFDNDNTIPFIARYRKHQTSGLDADQLRIIKECYDKVKVIKHKADLVLKSIEKAGKLTPELESTVKSLKTLNELEHIHSLYKMGAKKTLAERARDVGLGPIAETIMQSGKIPHFSTLINKNTEGLQDEEQIKNGVISILADIISKDKRTFDITKELREKITMQIQTKKTKQSDSSKQNDNESKYSMYYDWSSSEKYIKPHQILAINRAETEKVVTVQINVPNNFESMLKKNILQYHESAMNTSSFHQTLIVNAFHQAYNKSLKPALARRARSEMNEKAHEASIDVFAVNVKQLLLTQPVRGEVVIGVDPGFAHGCKLAAISKQGDVLETATIYPHGRSGNSSQQAADTLVALVRKHECSVLALGNATACRETELFLSDLIKSGIFGKQDVSYTIVDEAGASIYSCGDEAKSEFPHMDYNVISAVSIARRLQDPLAELVKVEPKHLGVGMYQHDLPPKQLMTKLNEAVMEVVSFVGVDINTASKSLLCRVAGLSESRATNIIEWRRENGFFISRDQLREVKGIGAKTFEQCAGFIRVMPETALSKSAQRSKATAKYHSNYLDQTWIHPESYRVADAFVDACKLDLANLGSREFISKVKIFASQGCEILAQQLQTNPATLEIIINGLTMIKGEDIRGRGNAPLFRKSLRSIDDLVVGSLLRGEARNITQFGVFVDVGVGKNGLIHVKNLAGEGLKIGQRVEVKVDSIEKERGRIGLTLIKSY